MKNTLAFNGLSQLWWSLLRHLCIKNRSRENKAPWKMAPSATIILFSVQYTVGVGGGGGQWCTLSVAGGVLWVWCCCLSGVCVSPLWACLPSETGFCLPSPPRPARTENTCRPCRYGSRQVYLPYRPAGGGAERALVSDSVYSTLYSWRESYKMAAQCC